MNELWELWIRVYQRTLGGQKKPSLRVLAPLPLSPFFLCRGEGAVTRRLGKTQQKKPAKGREKKIRETWVRTKPKTPRPFLRCHKKIIITT